jgi:L-methionine (R)-S-oxide reductase
MKTEQKRTKYERIREQLIKLIEKVDCPESRMATIIALLHHKMKDFFWTGFYFLKDGELLVSQYQGPLACLRLKKDTGVCWAGINQRETIVVENVEEFPGHIACSSLSKSEIVVPVFDQSGQLVGVLDIDSRNFANFDSVDAEQLKLIVDLIYKKF